MLTYQTKSYITYLNDKQNLNYFIVAFSTFFLSKMVVIQSKKINSNKFEYHFKIKHNKRYFIKLAGKTYKFLLSQLLINLVLVVNLFL